jgi:hypothetical protein
MGFRTDDPRSGSWPDKPESPVTCADPAGAYQSASCGMERSLSNTANLASEVHANRYQEFTPFLAHSLLAHCAGGSIRGRYRL